MPNRKTAHIVSHTHWDREWYLPYEKHHVRLIKLMDALLDKLDEDPEYRSFFLDGQTIILEDYLQVRPQQQTRLEKHISDGRILIGPWYILQDAFLTSSEANVRNMLIGHKDAKRYGQPAKIGYFPDTFGLAGQTPQLMRQSGIHNAFFGRGVKPTGFNNTVADGDYESSFSELEWEGPDGSKVLGILFANWYSNGNEVPADPGEAKEYWQRKLADAAKYASTGELLFMNGCDHQPIQLDLSEAIRTARELFPDTDFVHSNFIDYLAALESSLDRELSSVRGELRSQRTDGWGTLVNTASSRVYLKQLNQRGQAMLEKVAEPLAAYASLLGAAYPHDLLQYAWKTLMQNHPHDSICGCSVDEVHREMVTRFEKSRHVAEAVADDSLQSIAEHIDTTGFAAFGPDAVPFTVFNTTGGTRNGTVSVEVDVLRHYFREGIPFGEMKSRVKQLELADRIVVDSEGREVDCTITDLGLQFGYDLPDDKFRQPYFARKVRVELEAQDVPANGFSTYAVVRSASHAAASAERSTLVTGDRTMENEYVSVSIENDGSVTLTDKASGKIYSNLCVYEDSGDIGNEYMYRQPDGEPPLTTRNTAAEITILADKPYEASFRVVHAWDIPKGAEEKLAQEQQELVWFTGRSSGRSKETVRIVIETTLTLEKGSRGLKVSSRFHNQAKDHRLRMLFPTGLASNVHQADSMFEVVTRGNEPSAEWTNPSYCHHQQAFASIQDGRTGLTVANLGLNEYEVLQDGQNTIAVTLLRSVGELGDWGVFPTPEAQCLGEAYAELMIIPHGLAKPEAAYNEAYQFQVPWTGVQVGLHAGSLPPVYQWFGWHGEGIAQSAVKRSEETGDLIFRWYNLTSSGRELAVTPTFAYRQAYRSNILEERQDAVEVVQPGEALRVAAGPAEIVTLALEIADTGNIG
ncbi:alpha-mannosidase [Paenibacillus favisporus]|uniref:alpha-mannosidase n=1 Tax=Paenibacillus favisporus TaxID=221028 RepID=UPI002DB8541E|nr:alpha-mannosidase [Paenibacillus favisporus]MEC0175638.1 alpha-mannosidase [Paenibacillus favisporus]